jgi:hypothetical protein
MAPQPVTRAIQPHGMQPEMAQEPPACGQCTGFAPCEVGNMGADTSEKPASSKECLACLATYSSCSLGCRVEHWHAQP